MKPISRVLVVLLLVGVCATFATDEKSIADLVGMNEALPVLGGGDNGLLLLAEPIVVDASKFNLY